MNYEIESKQIEPIRVAFLKVQGQVREANKYFPDVFKAIQGKSCGSPLFNYLSISPETREGIVEFCVPTEAEPSGSGVMVKTLPEIKALCTIHIGSYESLNHAYKAIEQEAKLQNIKLGMPIREIYIKGPGMILKGNPNKYITEIQIPIEDQYEYSLCR